MIVVNVEEHYNKTTRFKGMVMHYCRGITRGGRLFHGNFGPLLAVYAPHFALVIV